MDGLARSQGNNPRTVAEMGRLLSAGEPGVQDLFHRASFPVRNLKNEFSYFNLGFVPPGNI